MQAPHLTDITNAWYMGTNDVLSGFNHCCAKTTCFLLGCFLLLLCKG